MRAQGPRGPTLTLQADVDQSKPMRALGAYLLVLAALVTAGCLRPVSLAEVHDRFHDADHRFHDTLAAGETRTHRFEVPPGTTRLGVEHVIVARGHLTWDVHPEGNLSGSMFTARPSELFLRGGVSLHGIAPGPWVLTVTAGAPAEITWGVYFHGDGTDA